MSGSWKWEEQLALHHSKMSLKLIGCTLQPGKMGDGEMASVREDRVGWRMHPTAKSVSADRDVFGSAGGVWWEGVNTWAVCCRRVKFPLGPQLGGSLPPAKTRMVRRSSRSSVLTESGCAEREATESQALSLWDKQPLLPSSSILLWCNRTKREEKHYCTGWKLL